MNAENTFQISTAAAESYETNMVPTVFLPLATATLDAISLPEHAQIIDIACGSGIIPKLLIERLQGAGRIVGADLNPAMIEVARKTMPPSHHRVEWFVSDVTDLPFCEGEFDIAFVQQGLQFFPDKPKALGEIRRVLAPGGRLVLTCWRSIPPLDQAVSDSLRKRLSENTAKQALGPFSFRNGDVITSLLTEAGFEMVDISSLRIDRSYSPSREAIRSKILASPYEDELRASGEANIDAIAADVDAALDEYRIGDAVIVPQYANLFQAKNA